MEIDNTITKDMESAITFILSKFDNVNREGLKDTPKRVVESYKELLICNEPKITVFDSKGYNQMIIDKDIQYYTFCEHHLLPFFGDVTIGYIPDKKIIGLSKLARIVDYFSKRLNTQEYFTQNILNYLTDILNPIGAGVFVKGRHLCKEMRGAKKNSTMQTMALNGIFLSKPDVKAEFISYCNHNGSGK